MYYLQTNKFEKKFRFKKKVLKGFFFKKKYVSLSGMDNWKEQITSVCYNILNNSRQKIKLKEKSRLKRKVVALNQNIPCQRRKKGEREICSFTLFNFHTRLWAFDIDLMYFDWSLVLKNAMPTTYLSVKIIAVRGVGVWKYKPWSNVLTKY